MYISLYGLAGAAVMLVLGLVQWVFLKRVFERSRQEQSSGWTAAERQKREADHRLLLKVLLVIDLLALPAFGYYVGQLVFEK